MTFVKKAKSMLHRIPSSVLNLFRQADAKIAEKDEEIKSLRETIKKYENKI